MTNSITEAHVPTRDVQNSFEMGRDTASTCYLVGVMLMFSGGGGGGIPSNYLVSTQLQFWLFCCWGGLWLLLGCDNILNPFGDPKDNIHNHR